MKGRVAKQIIDEAEESGSLNKKKTVLGISGGNTGVSLAWFAS
jgi:cysteine synthase